MDGIEKAGGCWDAVYTRNACCIPEPSISADASGCKCTAAADALIEAITNATADGYSGLGTEGTVSMHGKSRRASRSHLHEALFPDEHKVYALCNRYETLMKTQDPCIALRLAGHATCSHIWMLLARVWSLAPSHTGHHDPTAAAKARELATHHANQAVAAAAEAKLQKNKCPTALQHIVSAGFPFFDAEAVHNSERCHVAAGDLDYRGDAAGWRREWKPQIGVHSTLDELLATYQILSTLQTWQKTIGFNGKGCSGGDQGEDNQFTSPIFARFFDHDGLAVFPPGPSRHRPARILEIGVCDGAGVAVWSEYFDHQDSRVVALDLDLTLFLGNLPVLRQKGFNQSRLAAAVEANASALTEQAQVLIGGDPGKTLMMSGLAALHAHGPYDVIRDDASHIHTDIIATFEALFTTVLRPGGIYIIEDLWMDVAPKHATDIPLDQSLEFTYFFRLARDAVNINWALHQGSQTGATWQTAHIQSLPIGALDAWVDSVEFNRGLIVIRKRSE